jgi:hypothetical protein
MCIYFRRINALAAGDSMPMVSAGDRAPDYLCMDDVDEDIVTLEDEDLVTLGAFTYCIYI